MNESVERAYFVKKLYIDAGRRLMNDNFQYYSGTVNPDKTEAVSQRLLKLACGGLCAALDDKAGCCEDRVMRMTARAFGGSDTVFLFMDDGVDGKLMAVYAPGEKVFLFSDRHNAHPRLLSVNLAGCYTLPHRRKYTPRQYVEMSRYYFEKSECIDKELSL